MRVDALITLLFGRRRRTAKDQLREKVWTLATSLTLLRATVTSTIFVLAIIWQSHKWLLIALGVSMLMDFSDGFVARSRLSSETIFGAQLDGLADRIAAVFVIAASIAMRGDFATVLVAALIWLQFGVLDQFFAGQFLRFGLWSPDHFYEIDEHVWKLNWSPQAKLASNLPIALLAVGSWCVWPAAGLAVSLICVRLRPYAAIQLQARERIKEERFAYRAPWSEEVVHTGLDIKAHRVADAQVHQVAPVHVVAHR